MEKVTCIIILLTPSLIPRPKVTHTMNNPIWNTSPCKTTTIDIVVALHSHSVCRPICFGQYHVTSIHQSDGVME